MKFFENFITSKTIIDPNPAFVESTGIKVLEVFNRKKRTLNLFRYFIPLALGLSIILFILITPLIGQPGILEKTSEFDSEITSLEQELNSNDDIFQLTDLGFE